MTHRLVITVLRPGERTHRLVITVLRVLRERDNEVITPLLGPEREAQRGDDTLPRS